MLNTKALTRLSVEISVIIRVSTEASRDELGGEVGSMERP